MEATLFSQWGKRCLPLRGGCCSRSIVLILCSPPGRGPGGREGDPHRDGSIGEAEAPAPTQRALPLPAVREPTRHAHQVHAHAHSSVSPGRQCT